MGNEEIPQQKVDVLEEEQAGGNSDDAADKALWGTNSEEEQECRLPKRERRPPKTFTYDYLQGTPACYNVEQMNTIAFQSTPYEMHSMTPWTYPASQYQPVYFYPYKDLYAH